MRALSNEHTCQVLMRAQSAVPSKHAEHMHQEQMRTGTYPVHTGQELMLLVVFWIRIRMVPYSRRAKMMSNINLVCFGSGSAWIWIPGGQKRCQILTWHIFSSVLDPDTHGSGLQEGKNVA